MLPLAEHRWLGNDAYRLARSLAQEGLHQQACQVLELSCQELVIWCQGEFERSLEVSFTPDRAGVYPLSRAGQVAPALPHNGGIVWEGM